MFELALKKNHFDYETHMPDLEKFILNLDIFHGPQRLTWKDTFDIDFQDWNRCHYLVSDLSGLGQQLDKTPLLTYDKPVQNNYQLESLTMNTISQSLSVQDQKFMSENGSKYVKSRKNIHELVENKVLVTGVPIKLQTMLEKRLVIKNFDQCVEHYNAWVDKNGLGIRYSEDELQQDITKEIQQWHTPTLLQ